MAAVDTALDELIPKIGLLILNARLPEVAALPASPTHSPRRLSSAADNDEVRRAVAFPRRWWGARTRH